MAAARTQKRVSTSGKPTAPKRTAAPSRKRRRASWVTPAIVVISLVLAGWTIYPVLRLQYQHERELQTLQAELDGLKTRNEDLREQVEGLKTPEGVEQLARESLGMVKPGEQAYVVTGGLLGETSSTVLPGDGQDPPLWQQALDTVFGFR